MGKEKSPSHGEAVHRRRVLVQKRKKVPPDLIKWPVTEQQQTKGRLEEITNLLEAENRLSPQKKAALKAVEGIWLEFKLGEITQSKRQSVLDKFLNDLKQEEPEVHLWLTTKNGDNGPPPLVAIRDRVMPPRKIGGYYTKRN